MYEDQLDFWTCFLHNVEILTCSILHENVLRNQNSFLCNVKEIWVLLKSSLLGNNFIFCWCCFLFLCRNTEIWKTINIGYPILCGKVLAGLANWFLGPYSCCTPTTQTQNTQSGGHNVQQDEWWIMLSPITISAWNLVLRRNVWICCRVLSWGERHSMASCGLMADRVLQRVHRGSSDC